MLNWPSPTRAISRLGIAAAALLLAGCATPGPGPSYGYDPAPAPGGPVQPAPGGVTVTGQAFADDGTRGYYPPGSTMIVRVYDARDDVNRWAAQQLFRDGNGVLPWAYRIRLSGEVFNNLSLPAVAARIEAPDGTVIYRNTEAVVLRPGSPDNIPLVRQVPPGRR